MMILTLDFELMPNVILTPTTLFYHNLLTDIHLNEMSVLYKL